MNFKELIQARLQGIKNWIGAVSFKRRIIFLSALVFVLAAVTIRFGRLPLSQINQTQKQQEVISEIDSNFTKLQIPERTPPFFVLAVSSTTKYGILPSVNFTLTSREKVEASDIEKFIKASVPIKVQTVSAKEFRLVPKEALATDQLISISLAVKGENLAGSTLDRNYGWAFQTQGKFRVVSTIPGSQAKNVPVNTGIEFTFSQDDYQEAEKFITISPTISYKLERHGESLAIVPLSTLKAKTVYTVTLKKGLGLTSRKDPILEDYTITFQTGAEAVYNKPLPSMSLQRSFIQVNPEEKPAVEIYKISWGDEAIAAEIYKFAGGDDFITSRKDVDASSGWWYDFYQENEPVKTSNLALVGKVDLKPLNQNYVDYLEMPDKLSPGFYLVQLWYNGRKSLQQLWIQSSNLAGYTSIGRYQSLVWVNNLVTQEPVNGAAIRLYNSLGSYQTSDNGTAAFSTPLAFFAPGTHYLEVAKDTEKLYLSVNSLKGRDNAEELSAEDFWVYLYNDRLLYKPDDTVNFWGVVKTRNGSGISIVKATLTRSGRISIMDKEITVSGSGSFIGSFKFNDVPAGWYYLNIYDGDLLLESAGFEIKDYQKPELKSEITADKKAVFAGEKVSFTTKVSFFDETPAANLAFKNTENVGGKQTEIKTDKAGVIKYGYESSYSGNHRDYPRYEGVTVSPAFSQAENLEGYGSVYVYGAKVLLTTESGQNEGSAWLKSTVNRVDLTGINGGTSQEVKGETVPNQEVNLTITKTWYVRVETGTYYDFVEKITKPSYRYDRKTEQTVNTKIKSDAAGVVSYSFDMEREKSYELVLNTKDADGHLAESTTYFYYYEGWGTGVQNNTSPELVVSKEENTYSVGEDVRVMVQQNGKLLDKKPEERFLFIVARRGRQDFYVNDSPQLDFTFETRHIPNAYVAAVIFTGKHYSPVASTCRKSMYCYYDYQGYGFDGTAVYYQKENSKLDLAAVLEKPKYQPGETANIQVEIVKQGVPQPNTEVNLLLVDQALEAIGGVNKPDVLNSLYKTVASGIYYSYYTHKPLSFSSQAEMGGGGGGDFRNIFKDTALFAGGRTDDNGRVSFNVKLPDNLTTWLIYAQAANSNLDAGQTQAKIIVTKDFFVTSQFPRVYLAKDKPMLAANSFGEIAEADKVNYLATFFSGETKISTVERTQNAFSEVAIPFPVLDLGEYQAGLTGKFGNKSDGVLYPFSVIDTRLNFTFNQKYNLKAGESLTKLNTGEMIKSKPAQVVITDIGKGQYYYQLKGKCYYGGNRIEKIIAAISADKILADKFSDQSCRVKETDTDKFQAEDGGISQVWWGGSNLETSVWAVYVDPVRFDKEKLLTYFEKKSNEANSGTIQKINAYWGMSILGKPMINEIDALKQNAVTFNEKILTALALNTLGDTESARELYLDILADYAYSAKPYLRIQSVSVSAVNESQDTIIKNTAYTLLLSDLLGSDYNSGFGAYLRDFQGQAQDVVLGLANISFINNELKKLPEEDTSVTVKLAGGEETLDLKKDGSWATEFGSAADLKNMYVKVNTGKAEVNAYYNLVPSAFKNLTKDNRLTIKRSYRKVKGEGDKIVPGDIIEVKIDFNYNPDSPLGSYKITDYLPSGLAYLENPYFYGLSTNSWVNEEEKNVITHSSYYSRWWYLYPDTPIIYYVRAAAGGTYVWEPAVIQSQEDLSVFQATPEENIKIGE